MIRRRWILLLGLLLAHYHMSCSEIAWLLASQAKLHRFDCYGVGIKKCRGLSRMNPDGLVDALDMGQSASQHAHFWTVLNMLHVSHFSKQVGQIPGAAFSLCDPLHCSGTYSAAHACNGCASNRPCTKQRLICVGHGFLCHHELPLQVFHDMDGVTAWDTMIPTSIGTFAWDVCSLCTIRVIQKAIASLM